MNKASRSLILILTLAAALHGESILDEDAQSALLKSSGRTAWKMVSSLITTRTISTPGQWIFYGSGAVSFLDQIWLDPDISGNRLNGLSFGGGAGYGLNDRWDLNASLTGCSVDGRIEGDFYTELSEPTGADYSFAMVQLSLGGSYDLVNGKAFSLPLSCGLLGSYFAMEADLDRVTLTDTLTGTADASLEASGIIPGFQVGAGAEYRLNWIAFKTDAALAAMLPGLTGETELVYTPDSGGSSVTYGDDFIIPAQIGIFYGVGLELLTDRHWKFCLDFSDFLPLPPTIRGPSGIRTLGLTVSFSP